MKLATALRLDFSLRGDAGGAACADGAGVREVMNAGYSRWMPRESGAGANEPTLDSASPGTRAFRGAGLDERAGATAEATAVPGANPRLKFRVVLLPSGNFAPHFVQVWRESEFAILHFEQNIGTSGLL